jgi:hypothetical protein
MYDLERVEELYYILLYTWRRMFELIYSRHQFDIT